jgi:hypothetical protein
VAERSPRHPVQRIAVRIRVGHDLMAATDDPIFLGLSGPAGREFRLKPARGRALRRGAEDRYVLGAPDDPETNVEHPAFNDPGQPPIDADDIASAYLRKGFEPVPNVRALAEMDDRLEIEHVEVEISAAGEPKPRRFARRGPIWLGLVAGLRLEIPPADSEA